MHTYLMRFQLEERSGFRIESSKQSWKFKVYGDELWCLSRRCGLGPASSALLPEASVRRFTLRLRFIRSNLQIGDPLF